MSDLDRERDAFLRRTRKMVVALYVCLAIGTLASGVYALTEDTTKAVIGIAIGLPLLVLLALAGFVVPLSARASRVLIWTFLPVVVIGVAVFGLDRIASSPVFWGFFAGMLAGCAVGLAIARFILARRDDLWLRQKRLGFDPERPSDWMNED